MCGAGLGTLHPFLLPGDLFNPHPRAEVSSAAKNLVCKTCHALFEGSFVLFDFKDFCVFVREGVCYFFLEAADLIHSAQP